MNEKHHQYYNLQNNKALIAQNVPTANEQYEFETWRKKEERIQFQGIIILVIINIIAILLRNIWQIT